MSVKVRYSSEYLAHSGIKGQKWGVRRFQNQDGSLTPEGRRRYLKSTGEYTTLGKLTNLSRRSKDIKLAKYVLKSESAGLRGAEALKPAGKNREALRSLTDSKSKDALRYSKEVLNRWGKHPKLDNEGLSKKRERKRVDRVEQELGRAANAYRNSYSKVTGKPSSGNIGLTKKELAAEKSYKLSTGKGIKGKLAYKKARSELKKAIVIDDVNNFKMLSKSLAKASKAELGDMRKHTKKLISEIKGFPTASKKEKRDLVRRAVAKSIEAGLTYAIPVPVVSTYAGEHAGNIVRRMR